MQSNNLITENLIENGKKGENFFKIDLLKAIMIAFVIIDHAVGYAPYKGLGYELWERMSIPVFLIILGFNMGKSFQRQGDLSLKKLYSWNYFKKKLLRFVFPYLIFYIVSTTVGFIIYGASFPETFADNWILEYIVLQKSLLEGPGNWFIPVLFQSIILMPLLYKLFSKKPILTLIFCFIIEACMHLFLFFYIGPVTGPDDFLREIPFRELIFLYLSAIGMGIWFSQNHKLFSKRNLFVWIMFPVVLIYMIAWDFFGFRLQINGSGIVRGDYNYLTFIYAALIFLIVLQLVPKNPKNIFAKAITPIGKATFHIYLVQDLYYIILYINYNAVWTFPGFAGLVNPLGIASIDVLLNFGLLVINWIICISVGTIWWYIEKKGLSLFLRK
jgi:peptidoglycan/LPS O-acetylase OafA/YrhL